MKILEITPQAEEANLNRSLALKTVEKTLCLLTGHLEKSWGNLSTEYGSFCVCCQKTLCGDAKNHN